MRTLAKAINTSSLHCTRKSILNADEKCVFLYKERSELF